MDIEKLFEEVGFTHNYRKKMVYFYSPYFETDDEMNDFFVKVFESERTDYTSRRMINQIQRLVTLANDIDKICPNRDSLRMLFLKICLDSLAKLSGMENKDFYNSFPQMMSEEGKKYILDNFRLSYFQDLKDNIKVEEYALTINDFFRILKTVRDMVVHDGNYWEAQFFAHYEDDSDWLTSIESDEKVLENFEYAKKPRHNICYFFETTMLYDRFIEYFVETCIAFVKEYIGKRVVIE